MNREFEQIYRCRISAQFLIFDAKIVNIRIGHKPRGGPYVTENFGEHKQFLLLIFKFKTIIAKNIFLN